MMRKHLSQCECCRACLTIRLYAVALLTRSLSTCVSHMSVLMLDSGVSCFNVANLSKTDKPCLMFFYSSMAIGKERAPGCCCFCISTLSFPKQHITRPHNVSLQPFWPTIPCSLPGLLQLLWAGQGVGASCAGVLFLQRPQFHPRHLHRSQNTLVGTVMAHCIYILGVLD